MARMFKEYSDHEESLRASLAKFDASKPGYDWNSHPTLKDWKRVFWLDPAMIPCRKKAQRLILERARIEKDGWVAQRHLSPSTEADLKNREALAVLESYVEEKVPGAWGISDHWGGDLLNESTTHLESEVPLEVLMEFLSNFSLSSPDLININSVQLAIEALSNDLARDSAVVYLMAQGADRSYRRRRSIEGQKPLDLFQGKGDGKRQGRYVGDRKVKSDNKVSLQVHLVDVFADKSLTGQPLRSGTPAIALCLPDKHGSWARKVIQQA
jgi:hypothetical protein